MPFLFFLLIFERVERVSDNKLDYFKRIFVRFYFLQKPKFKTSTKMKWRKFQFWYARNGFCSDLRSTNAEPVGWEFSVCANVIEKRKFLRKRKKNFFILLIAKFGQLMSIYWTIWRTWRRHMKNDIFVFPSFW